MANFTKQQVVKNFSWRYLGRFGSQIISFAVTIILARLLTPDAFGAVAIVSIFTNFLQVFIDSGLGTALVQKKNADEIDFSSVFYFNVIICLLLYALLYFFAPVVAVFYDDPFLTPLLRVSSLSLIITGLRSTQETYVTRNLLFKSYFIATAIAVISSAIIAVVMAYAGFGAWAIVGQQIGNTGISTLLLWFLISWRPHLLFSFKRLKGLLQYGWKILGASLVDNLYTEIRSLLIGKVYTAKDLAFYDQGKTFPYMIVSGVNNALNSVIFPVLSRSQENINDIKRMVRKTICVSTFVISSILSIIFCSSKSMVLTLMTEKWVPCVVYMQILCFDSLFWPIITTHYNSFKAVGDSGVFFKYMFVTKFIGVLMLLLVLRLGVIWIALSSVAAMIVQTLLVSIESKKRNNYAWKEQFQDLRDGFTPAFFIFISTYWLNWVTLPSLFIFILQIIIGLIVFVGCVLLCKNDSVIILKNMIIDKIKKK